MPWTRVAYLVAVAALGLAFLDAPLKAMRMRRQETPLGEPSYSVANALAVVVGLSWLALLLWPGLDPRSRAIQEAGGGLVAALGVAGAWLASLLALWARLTLGPFFLPTAAVVAGHELVVQGPYRLVRHPFYAGAWLVVLTGALALGSLASLVAALLLAPLVLVLARGEEGLLATRFGAAYQDYAQRVPRFVPRLRRRERKPGAR